MTQKPNQAPEVMNFLAIAATSPSLRNAGVREATAAGLAKRVARTSLINAEWAPLSVTRDAHRSGARRILARPPHTSLIDAAWDREPGADELDPVITFVELDGPECLFDLDF